MTRDSDRNGDSRQDRNGLGPKGESAGRQASPNSSHRPEDVGLVEKVARAICISQGRDPDRVSPFIKGPVGQVPDIRHDRLWKNYEDVAQAAIEAILTPYTVDDPNVRS